MVHDEYYFAPSLHAYLPEAGKSIIDVNLIVENVWKLPG